MAVYTADSLSGGSIAGGIFNLSDADLIAQTVSSPSPNATNIDRILSGQGATTGSTDEVWGMVEV